MENTGGFKTFHEYMENQVNTGYIDNNGRPLKCQYCEGTEFKYVNEHYCQYGLEEYEFECKSCGKIVGHWAYGYWMV